MYGTSDIFWVPQMDGTWIKDFGLRTVDSHVTIYRLDNNFKRHWTQILKGTHTQIIPSIFSEILKGAVLINADVNEVDQWHQLN